MGRPRKPRDEDLTARSRDDEERDAQTRTYDERDDLPEDPESPLFVPPEEWPEGKWLRWIRIEAHGARDNKNWSMMTRAGWEPVARTGKLAKRFPASPFPGQGDIYDNLIVLGGLCLCQRDARLVLRDRKTQERATAMAGQSIKPYLIDNGGTSFQQMPRTQQADVITTSRGAPAFKD